MNKTQTIIINNYSIDGENLTVDTEKISDREFRKISFNFKVENKDYHAITTLLYTNDFTVEIPAKNIAFRATIYSYATSVTNLYEEGAVGNFKLALIEKV